MALLPILPTYVRSTADLAGTIALGNTFESIVLEFKRELPNGWRAPADSMKRQAQKELCRDIAQFANTYGGCLLYGVEEQESAGSRVASSLNPITDIDGHREWLQQAVQNFLVPATLTLQIERIEVTDGCVMAVNIPPSLHLVSLWDQQVGTIECVYRTNHGKAYMNQGSGWSRWLERRRRYIAGEERLLLNEAVNPGGHPTPGSSRASTIYSLVPFLVDRIDVSGNELTIQGTTGAAVALLAAPLFP